MPLFTPVMESLEGRKLFAVALPTDFEQYQLELVNRARANPPAEVTRLSGATWGDDPAQVPGTAFPRPQTPDLNEGLPAGTISPAAKQPLAFNTSLIQAARDYSQTLIDNNAFEHEFGGTTPQSRMQAAGYVFTPTSGAGENLAAGGSTGPITRGGSTGNTLKLLQGAAHAGTSVWIGYVDSHGVASRRIVRPVSVGGGVLEGFDRMGGELRRFPLHRITSAAAADL